MRSAVTGPRAGRTSGRGNNPPPCWTVRSARYVREWLEKERASISCGLPWRVRSPLATQSSTARALSLSGGARRRSACAEARLRAHLVASGQPSPSGHPVRSAGVRWRKLLGRRGGRARHTDRLKAAPSDLLHRHGWLPLGEPTRADCYAPVKRSMPARTRRPGRAYSAATGILPIFACHSRGPVWCTEVPSLDTATVTGMSLTSNS